MFGMFIKSLAQQRQRAVFLAQAGIYASEICGRDMPPPSLCFQFRQRSTPTSQASSPVS